MTIRFQNKLPYLFFHFSKHYSKIKKMSKKEIKSVNYSLEKIFAGAQDFLPLLGTDYVEFYVGNAKQAAHFYKTAFGFQSMPIVD